VTFGWAAERHPRLQTQREGWQEVAWEGFTAEDFFSLINISG